jgi:polyisoprenoid-binding protein YceI
MNRFLIAFMLIAASLLETNPSSAQNYTATQGEILVLGTANTRSWSLQTQDLDCQATITVSEDKLKISSLRFAVKAEDLKGHNVWMNTWVYKALKAYPFENIIYKGVLFTASTESENNFIIKIEGNLTIAGVTRITPLLVKATVDAQGNILCTGSTAIKMSDFKVQLPPSENRRMEVGDEVIMSFAIELHQ